MNERFEAIKQSVLAPFRRARVFYSGHRLLLLSGLTIVSILLIVWARMGFTLQFSQFFASGTPTGQCHWQNPDERGTPDCACNAANRVNMCHVCTPSWQEGNTDYSDGQWTAWDSEGLCRPACPNSKFPYLTGRTKRDGSVFTVPQGCVEKPDDCPDGYHALTIGGGSTICEVNAPAPTPTPVPPQTPTPTPTPSPTPTPTPSPTASPTVSPTPTPTASASPVPTATPTPSPTMTATTMPVPVPGYTIAVSGRNVTTASPQAASVQLQGGQQAEVIVAVRNTTTALNATGTVPASLSNVVVRAVLPKGLEYIAESTSVAGVPTTIDSVTTGGIALGTIAPQQEVSLVFRVRAVTSLFVVGTTQASIVVSATVANANQQTATLPVIVTRVTAGVPGTVKTGPGDAVLVALLMSAIVTLLYVSYTHTSAYKRKEIEAITQGRNPMDFRS